MTDKSPSAAQRLLQTAAELGVEYIFTNLGSDHPAFIEAFSRIDEIGGLMPKIVICPFLTEIPTKTKAQPELHSNLAYKNYFLRAQHVCYRALNFVLCGTQTVLRNRHPKIDFRPFLA